MPGGLTKFDTDDVEKYPLFSIDIYNSQLVSNHAELSSYLENAVISAFPSGNNGANKEVVKEVVKKDEENIDNNSIIEKNNEIELQVEVEVKDRTENIPDLRAMHLLKSTDKLSCIVLAAWTGTVRYTFVSTKN